MKHLFFLLLCVSSLSSFAQFDKQTTFRASASFSIPTNGLVTNDGGAGLGLDISFFSKHKLQALVETSVDRFWGDKLMPVFETPQELKKATVYQINVGPQYFFSKNIAASLTYGPSWHTVRNVKYSVDGGFKFALTGFWGAKRRFVTKAFFVDIPNSYQTIQYIGVAAGYRF